MGTALSDLGEVPAWSLSEDAVQDRFSQALQVRARVEELTSRLLASIIGRDIPRIAGTSSTRAWLMATRGLSVQDAARLVREAAVHDSDGDGGASHAEPNRTDTGGLGRGRGVRRAGRLIGGTIDRLDETVPEPTVVSLQSDLVRHARTLSYVQLQQVCRHAVEVVDPHGADAALAHQLETEEERARRLCDLTFRRSGDGWTGFAGRLPDAQADLWRNILNSITSPRHERAVTTAATDTGMGNGSSDDDRPHPPSYPQRLGRALMELIEHLPVDRLPQHGTNPCTLMITMTLDQLRSGLGEALLDTGTPMSPSQCRRLACNANLIPVVLGSDSAILDLGLTRRLFDRYQRLALALRDGGCIWPGCERTPAWCEAHHITFWTDGGPTDLANGCLLCPYHHHLIHSCAGWQIHMASEGLPEVIPPVRLAPARQPRRHERFRPRQC